MTKKNIGRHMRNVCLMESKQVSEILKNSFNKTPEISVGVQEIEVENDIPDQMDVTNVDQVDDPDDSSILSGMETMLARHSKSIHYQNQNQPENPKDAGNVKSVEYR